MTATARRRHVDADPRPDGRPHRGVQRRSTTAPPAVVEPPRARPPRHAHRRRRCSSPSLLLALWQWVTSAGIVASYQLPSPASVWDAAVDLAQRGLLGQYVAISTQRVLIGFAIGSAIGLVLAAVVGLSRLGDALLAPTLGAHPRRAVARLGPAAHPLDEDRRGLQDHAHRDRRLLPGLHDRRGGAAARRRAPGRGRPRLRAARRAAVLERAAARGRSRRSCPGLRLAIAQSWLFLVAAELIASSMGLGFLLVDSGNNGRVDRIILAIIAARPAGQADRQPHRAGREVPAEEMGMTSTISTLQSEARTVRPAAGVRDANVGPEAFDRAEPTRSPSGRTPPAGSTGRRRGTPPTAGRPRSTTADGDLTVPEAQWFVGGRLNVAVNCVDRHVDAGRGDKVALHVEGEPGDRRDAHLRRPAARGRPCRARAHGPRHRPGRPRRRLPAGARRDRRSSRSPSPASAPCTRWSSAASPPRRCGSACRTRGRSCWSPATGSSAAGRPSR